MGNKKEYATIDEWTAEGKRLFGEDILNWKFKCPACGNIAKVSEFKDAGAEPNDSYQCCIGRFNGKKKGCDWAAFGLFDICNVHVISGDKKIPVFEFAEE